MKRKAIPTRGLFLLSMAVIPLSPITLRAADGIWTNTTAGPNSWSDGLKWNGGIIADGSTSTAAFTSDIAATTSVNLDSSRNIGNITFSDNGASGSTWLLSSSNGSILTLGDGVTAETSTINNLTGSEISLTLSGANRLAKTGGGRLWLTGANTYSGGMTINGFYLGINNDAALGAVPESFTADNIIMNSGTLSNFAVSNNSGIVLHANRGITLASGTNRFDIGTHTMVVNGVITGSGNLSKTSTGTLVLEGLNTYTGTTSISEGTLSISSLNSVTGGSAASSLGAPTTVAAGTIALGSSTGTTSGTLRYTGSGQNTDRVINLASTTGGGVLDQSGTGLLRFTSAFTSTGAGSKNLTLQGSTAGTGEIAGAIVDNSATNITNVIKTGSGTWTLSGTNTHTGTTTVTAGVLRLNSAGALSGGVGSTGGTSALLFNGSGSDGGVIGLTSATGDFTRTIGSTNPGATQVGWASGATGGFAAFGGDRSVNFGGAGSTMTWSGTGGVFGGGLILGHSTSDSTVTVVNNINLNLVGPRTVTVNDGSANVDAILSGVISQARASLIKAGSGTLALTATNTFGSNTSDFPVGTSFTTISAGTLQLGNGGATGSLTSTGTGDIQNDGTLAINRNNGITLQHIVKGSGAIHQIGTGTTTLTAANTYTGTTTVSGGTLVINGNQSGATGALNANASTTLKGSGTIGGAVTISGSSGLGNQATHAPGNSVGTQTVGNDFTYGQHSIFEWELASNTTTGRGTNFDAVNITGAGSDLTIHEDLGIGTVFRIVLGTDFDGMNAFWLENRSWDVFNITGTNSTQFRNFELFNASAPITPVDYATYGTFSYGFADGTGSLHWTAVPEPSTSMIGLVISAGLLRRRR